jgi:hypothetical protein
MRTLLTSLAALLLFAACPSSSQFGGPPRGQLYYPTGVVHVDRPGSTEGVLFVANANFDKRYATGSVVGFRLDGLGLPPLGQLSTDTPQIRELAVQERAVVQVASFTGEMTGLSTGPDGVRLFVPSRSEGNLLQAVDVTFDADGQPSLACVLPPGAAAGASRTDCTGSAPSMTQYEFDEDALPRAPVPYGVAAKARSCAVDPDCVTPLADGGVLGAGRACVAGRCTGAGGEIVGDVWVTHLSQADSPLASGRDLRAYAVRLDSDALQLGPESYLNIGAGGGSSVAVGERWAYVSGRIISASAPAQMVRMVDRSGVVWQQGLENDYRVAEGRGLAVSSDERRLYVVGRVPDTLIVIGVDDARSASPKLNVVRAVPLPNGANELRVIPRTGRSDLVAVTCTSGGVLALYDDDVGELVAQVQGVGLQSFGLAVAARAGAARLFVGNFSDGRITVIDVADLSRPHEARIAAYLGLPQLCITRGLTAPGCRETEVSP